MEVTMKTQRNILLAFFLNLGFSVFEFIGGILTGSVAILSDAIHDIGDAASIGIAYALERKSKKQPDAAYTYGYTRYSTLGSLITTLILLLGSIAMICSAISRLIHPTPIHYDGMILFAVAGVCVNLCAAFFTRNGDSLNQKAVNLHMLEDVLGWIVVLVGAIVMRFTGFAFLDPLMSMAVSVFILGNAIKYLKAVVDLFLEKTPHNVDIAEITAHICAIDGVTDVHHIHVWSTDGVRNYATMHIVTNSNPEKIKQAVRHELREHGISHATLELESENAQCHEKHCTLTDTPTCSHGHHHHGHHHH